MRIAGSYFASQLLAAFLAGMLAPTLIAQPLDPCSRRTILVSVADAQGNPASNLSAADFTTEISGQPTAVLSVKPMSGARRLVIAIDASGSISGEPNTWLLVRVLAEDMISRMPSTPIAVIMFSENVERQTDFSTNRAGLFRFIQSLLTSPAKSSTVLNHAGGTGIFDSLQSAFERLAPAQRGDAIYLISDGLDNHSEVSAKKLERKMNESGVRLLGFLLNNPSWHTLLPTDSSQTLTAINASGGAAAELEVGRDTQLFVNNGSRDLNPKIKNAIESHSVFLSKQIASPLLIELGLSDALLVKHKPQKLSLKLKDASSSQNSWQIFYPRELAACPEVRADQ